MQESSMVRTVGFLSDIVSSHAILDCIFYVLIKIKKKKEKILHFFRHKSFFYGVGIHFSSGFFCVVFLFFLSFILIRCPKVQCLIANLSTYYSFFLSMLHFFLTTSVETVFQQYQS